MAALQRDRGLGPVWPDSTPAGLKKSQAGTQGDAHAVIPRRASAPDPDFGGLMLPPFHTLPAFALVFRTWNELYLSNLR